MVLLRLIIFFVILGVCSSDNYLNGSFGELNSRHNVIKKLETFIERKVNGVSRQCNNQIEAYKNGLSNKKSWALKMFDATSKFPSGLKEGNFVDLGFFDECLEIEGETIRRISGKYCLGTLPRMRVINQTQGLSDFNSNIFQPNPRNVMTPDQTVGLQFGICIPKACSAKELGLIFAENDLKMVFYDELCQTKSEQPDELDIGAIATLSFFGVILWLMLICTTYDVMLYYSGKPQVHPILTSFSVLTNGKKLLKTSNNPNQISCLHGIRVITTMWVILAHRYIFQVSFPVRNFLYVQEWMNNKAHMFVINAPLAVDTFFLMSGLVVAYIYMSSVSKGNRFNIFLFYFHRYVRLTPVLAVIILIHVTLIEYFGSGPIYPNSVDFNLIDGCKQYWWKALLYIQNYGAQESICVSQSWYLSVDTQLFILSPIILIPLKLWPGFTLIATGILTFSSMLVSFLTGWFLELNISILGNTGPLLEDYMKWYYFATQTRAGPWFIGIIFGYYIFQVKQGKIRLTLNKGLVLILWIVSLTILCACVFTGNNLIFGEYNKVASSIHLALVRPAWAIALGLIIFACVVGYGGPVNSFLSLPIFQILSKFTYTLYLLHLQVIVILTAQMRTPPRFSNGNEMYAFWGDFALSLVLAVLFTLAFESPIITIEQTIFGRTKKKPIEP